MSHRISPELGDHHMKRLFVIAALFCLVVPTALAVPPAGKGKPASSESAQSTQSADKNAAKACKAERAKIGVEAFKTKYGTNANKANAFGKCVSGTAKTMKDDEKADDQAEANAAKTCKAERTKIGVEAFKTKYGTNANKANAFGKCVSSLAKGHGSSS